MGVQGVRVSVSPEPPSSVERAERLSSARRRPLVQQHTNPEQPKPPPTSRPTSSSSSRLRRVSLSVSIPMHDESAPSAVPSPIMADDTPQVMISEASEPTTPLLSSLLEQRSNSVHSLLRPNFSPSPLDEDQLVLPPREPTPPTVIGDTLRRPASSRHRRHHTVATSGSSPGSPLPSPSLHRQSSSSNLYLHPSVAALRGDSPSPRASRLSALTLSHS